MQNCIYYKLKENKNKTNFSKIESDNIAGKKRTDKVRDKEAEKLDKQHLH